jgi:hypothetical protein
MGSDETTENATGKVLRKELRDDTSGLTSLDREDRRMKL